MHRTSLAAMVLACALFLNACTCAALPDELTTLLPSAVAAPTNRPLPSPTAEPTSAPTVEPTIAATAPPTAQPTPPALSIDPAAVIAWVQLPRPGELGTPTDLWREGIPAWQMWQYSPLVAIKGNGQQVAFPESRIEERPGQPPSIIISETKDFEIAYDPQTGNTAKQPDPDDWRSPDGRYTANVYLNIGAEWVEHDQLELHVTDHTINATHVITQDLGFSRIDRRPNIQQYGSGAGGMYGRVWAHLLYLDFVWNIDPTAKTPVFRSGGVKRNSARRRLRRSIQRQASLPIPVAWS